MAKKPKNKTVIAIVVDVLRLPKGHRPHRSGAGTHSSETNRLRTRSAKKRQAIKEYFE